jgi:hypothetical protein
MKKIISLIVFFIGFSAHIFASEIEYSNSEWTGDQEYKVLLILEKINQKNERDSCEVSALKAMFLVELDILIKRTKDRYIPGMGNYLRTLKRDLKDNKWPDLEHKKKMEEYYFSELKKFEQEEEKLRLRESWLDHPPFDN